MKILTKPNQINWLDDRFYHVANDENNQPIYFDNVTGILNEYAKGFGFETWLKDVGHNAGIIANRAAESGTIVHRANHILSLGGEVNWADKVEGDYTYHGNHYTLDEWRGILRFQEFMQKYKPIPLNPECIVYSKKYRYAGTVDLPCMIGDERWIIDHKFSNEIYETAFLQVAAYAFAWNEMYPEQKIDKVGVLHLRAKTRGADKSGKNIQGHGWKLAVHPYSIEELFEVFLHALGIHNHKVKRGELPSEPANRTYPTRIKLENIETKVKL